MIQRIGKFDKVAYRLIDPRASVSVEQMPRNEIAGSSVIYASFSFDNIAKKSFKKLHKSTFSLKSIRTKHFNPYQSKM